MGRPLDPLLAPLGGGGTTLSPATLGHPAAAAAHAQHVATLAANGVMLGATTKWVWLRMKWMLGKQHREGVDAVLASVQNMYL